MNKTFQTDTNWAEIVLTQDGMDSIERLAVKRFSQGVIAEEATTYVIEQLSKDNWEKCQSFKNQSKPLTFLYTIVNNLIEEFARKRFGRPRPPSWLKRQGDLWVKVWRYICLERQPKLSVVERLSYRELREPSMIEGIITTIKARIPSCGLGAMDHTLVENIDQLSDSLCAEESDVSTESSQELALQHEVLLMLRSVCTSPIEVEKLASSSIEASLDKEMVSQHVLMQLREAIQLTNEERVMLKMIYVDGLSKTATSKALGLPSHQAGKIINQTLAKISDALEAYGLDIEQIIKKV